MGSILSGIALHGPTRPYGGTFLIFSDYMRGAVRLASVMQFPVIYVWTHDSIGLGEDGPTHQPIEHMAALRAIPGLSMVRPGDATETAGAWKAILERTSGPCGLALTRQNIPVLEGTSHEGVAKGGYVLAEASSGLPQVILIATGSELQMAVEAREVLEADGVAHPGGVDAVHGVVPGAGQRLPRVRAAADRQGQGLRGGGHRHAVAPVHRRCGRERFHRALRGKRGLQDTVPRVRFHHRERGRRRDSAASAKTS